MSNPEPPRRNLDEGSEESPVCNAHVEQSSTVPMKNGCLVFTFCRNETLSLRRPGGFLFRRSQHELILTINKARENA